MAKEIERKFLVDPVKWKEHEKPVGNHFRQGYLLIDPKKSIRIRATATSGFVTIKGAVKGTTRAEYEYPIPLKDAVELLDNYVVAELSKIRYLVHYKNKLWEVDEFSGDNSGLLIAEIELKSEDELFELPDWIGEEVTDDERYYNAYLVLNPYRDWKSKDS